MTAPKVLISDKMDPKAAAIFKERGIDVDVITGKTKDELIAMIGAYDGLAIRSLQMIFAHLPAAYDSACSGTPDPAAREKMANAATMAGMAFANAFLGVLIPLAGLAMIWPDVTRSSGIGVLSTAHAWFLPPTCRPQSPTAGRAGASPRRRRWRSTRTTRLVPGSTRRARRARTALRGEPARPSRRSRGRAASAPARP